MSRGRKEFHGPLRRVKNVDGPVRPDEHRRNELARVSGHSSKCKARASASARASALFMAQLPVEMSNVDATRAQTL